MNGLIRQKDITNKRQWKADKHRRKQVGKRNLSRAGVEPIVLGLCLPKAKK